MSFTRRILDGVSSLLEKVAADDTPLTGVAEEELQAELEARAAAFERGGRRAPGENPLAKLAGAGDAARKKRAELAEKRERRIRGEREKRAAEAKRAQDEAFHRMKEEARRRARSGAGPRPGTGSAGGPGARQGAGARPGAGAGRRRAGFGGGKREEIAKAYRVLNLPEGAPFSEVKTAYRKLMRRYHPDLHNQSPKKQKAATELSMQVTQAYSVLEKHLEGR